MKIYIIKYETYSGNVFTDEIAAHDQESAKCQLLNCKEIYWIRLKSSIHFKP